MAITYETLMLMFAFGSFIIALLGLVLKMTKGNDRL